MELKKYTVVLFTLTLLVALSLVVFARITISNTGRVIPVNIDVYDDAALTMPLQSIHWGEMVPGESKNYSCYVVDIGGTPVNVSAYSANWVPANATDYLSLDYFIENKTLDVGESRLLILQLSVDSTVTGFKDFVFDIIVEGSFNRSDGS